MAQDPEKQPSTSSAWGYLASSILGGDYDDGADIIEDHSVGLFLRCASLSFLLWCFRCFTPSKPLQGDRPASVRSCQVDETGGTVPCHCLDVVHQC